MQQTNELVKQNIIEFLQFNGYSKTAEKLAKETPKPISSGLKHDPLPKIISLEQARAIFTIAVSCLQHLHNLKEGTTSTEGLSESIETYKVELGKYHKILLTE